MADIQQQLATLLGGDGVVQLRKTDEVPPRISVIEVAALITGKNHDAASGDFRRMMEHYPEVRAVCTDFRFPGRGQRNTLVSHVRGMVEVIMLLPGRCAARVRRQAAELLCRWLGGDLSIIEEVCRIRELQGQRRYPTGRSTLRALLLG